MFQIRPSGGTLWYAPGRDVVYLGPSHIEGALSLLEAQLASPSSDLQVYLQNNGLKAEDGAKYISIFKEVLQEELQRSEGKIFEDSRLKEIPFPWRVLFFHYIGYLFTGSTLHGIRQTCHTNALDPVQFYEDYIHNVTLS